MNPTILHSETALLYKWRSQIDFSIEMLTNGVNGFNRTLSAMNEDDVTNRMWNIEADSRFTNISSSQVYSSENNKKKIREISIKSTGDNNKPQNTILDIDPSIPFTEDDFSLAIKKSNNEIPEILDRVIKTQHIVTKHLLNIKPGDKIHEQALKAAKKDYIDTISSFSVITKRTKLELFGQPDLESFLNKQVIDILKYPKLYQDYEVYFPQSFLLYGAPGCGKTSAINQLAEVTGLTVYYLDSLTVGGTYIHETPRKIDSLFEAAKKTAPSIVIIDEVDTFLSEAHKNNAARSDEVATLLKYMNTAEENKILVVGMTNNLDSLSNAAKRAGRFTNKFEVKPLQYQNIKDLLCHVFKAIKIKDDALNMKNASKYLASKKQCTVADVYAFKKSVCIAAATDRLYEIDEEFIDAHIRKLSTVTDKRD